MIGIHENGELKALNNGYTLGTSGGGGTAIPTADTNAKFDSDAHMNSTDMTTGADSELEDFIDGLNIVGTSVLDIKNEGTKSISTGSVTSLVSSFALPSSGLWLVLSDVWVTSTGSSSTNVHNRLTVDGIDRITQINAVKNFHCLSFAIATGGNVELNTFQNTGATQTIAYELHCIKLK